MLRPLTIFINFLALAGAVWLGVYLVTRSPRSLIAWLTSLTLWSLAGLFLNVLLAVYPPNHSRFHLFLAAPAAPLLASQRD